MARADRGRSIDELAAPLDGNVLRQRRSSHRSVGQSRCPTRCNASPLRGRCGCLGIHPSGALLAVAGDRRRVDIWDVDKRECVVAPSGAEVIRINCVAFSPDGKLLAAADSSGMLTIWDANRFLPKLAVQADELSVDAIAFSPNSRCLASGGSNRLVKLWDVETGELQASLAGHDDAITAIAYSPDGLLLATGSDDTTARIWSVPKHQEILTLRGHVGSVSCLAFSPDGQRLVSLCKRTDELRFWDAPRSVTPIDRQCISDRLPAPENRQEMIQHAGAAPSTQSSIPSLPRRSRASGSKLIRFGSCDGVVESCTSFAATVAAKELSILAPSPMRCLLLSCRLLSIDSDRLSWYWTRPW